MQCNDICNRVKELISPPMFNKQHINDVKRQHRCNKSATVVNCYKLSLQTAQFVFLLDYSKTAKPCGAKRTSS